ncbi:cupin domain-containing protein [Candidatus Zixiibacteriota bacterium]
MFIKHADNEPVMEVAAGTKTTMQVLVSSDEGPNFALRRFIMEPGGGMPLHTNAVEHEQYVLRGRARVRLGEKVVEVSADDATFIPAGVPHSYEVIGDDRFEFICVVPNQQDEIEVIEEPGC